MILFVDDETKRMENYVEELELLGYEVEFKSDVDSAMEFFEKNQEKIELLILDIMMPPGKIFEKADTQLGLRTGISFYEQIRSHNPMLFIIILTNVSDDKAVRNLEKDPKTLFLQKEDFLSDELADKVKQVLGSQTLGMSYNIWLDCVRRKI